MALFKLSLLIAAATTTLAQVSLNFIFSRGDFATIAGTTGNEFGHSAGFTITDEGGQELYSEQYPDNTSPCAAVGDGQIFSVASSCWSGEYLFKCKSDAYANYENCSVDYQNGQIVEGDIDSDIDFVGIAIAIEGHCGAAFATFEDTVCEEGATFDLHYVGT